MPTIEENLQTLIDIKDGLKEALTSQGKEPTDAMGSYAGLIDGLENPDKVVYMVSTNNGATEAYAQLVGEKKVTLTATANDIRENTVAIVDSGIITGEKFIPSYHTSQGVRLIPVGSELKVELSDGDKYDYTEFQAMIMPWNTSLSDSVAVDRAVINNNVYNAGSTESISVVSKDIENKCVLLGIINEGDTPLIIRFITYKEVP